MLYSTIYTRRIFNNIHGTMKILEKHQKVERKQRKKKKTNKRAEHKIHDRRSRKKDSHKHQSDFELINVPRMLCASVRPPFSLI